MPLPPESRDVDALLARVKSEELLTLLDYDPDWLNDVLSLMAESAGLASTIENRMRFAAMLDSDLYCAFHSADNGGDD